MATESDSSTDGPSLRMPQPKKIPPRQLERIKSLEAKFQKALSSGDLKQAKRLLDEFKPTLETYNKPRLLENYLKLYEAALESWNLPVAKRGLDFVRRNCNKSTRLHLEATTLLAIAHLREGNLFSAEPLMAEVLRNDEVIQSEDTRRIFRREVIDRFDQEGALSAFAKVYPEIKTETQVQSEAVQLLREGKNEDDLLEGLGADTPLAVKEFMLKIDRLSKNILPDAERLLLPSPQEIIKDGFAGRIIFSAIKRGLYRRVCDEDSEVYQAWISGGLDKVLAGGLVAVVVLDTLEEFRIRYGALAVWATAFLMKRGINNFCETSVPQSLMDLRRKRRVG